MHNILQEFSTIALVHLLAVASPGPDFAVIIRQVNKYGKIIGIKTAAGIGAGILVHLAYILLGFTVIISSNTLVYRGFSFLAATYLIYLGIQSLMAKRESMNNDVEEAGQKITTTINAFKVGFLTNVLNPKASLFFLSVYTAIVHPDRAVSYQIFYGVYMAIATFFWFSLISFFLGNTKVRSRYLSYSHWIERVIGAVLLLLAVLLIID